MTKFSHFLAIVIAIVTLFSICALAEGAWTTEGDICYWLEDGVKSRAHKHTEAALEDYITKYEGDYAYATCPICSQTVKFAHEHTLEQDGPSMYNLKTYWTKGEYVIDKTYHWTYLWCTTDGCSYEKYIKEKHDYDTKVDYDATTGKDTVTKTCKVCGYETVSTRSHQHTYSDYNVEIYCECLNSHFHNLCNDWYCTTCGAVKHQIVYAFVEHFMWDDNTWYENGKIYKHWYCHEGCGYEYTSCEGDCDHNPDYVTFTYKPMEGSTMIEKVCNCCGKTVEYVENNSNSATGYVELNLETVQCSLDVTIVADGIKIKMVVPIDYENKNEVTEGEFTANKLCYVAPYSAANGVSEKTVFTGAKFWSIDENGTVTYELLTSDGLVGFAHAEDINW